MGYSVKALNECKHEIKNNVLGKNWTSYVEQVRISYLAWQDMDLKLCEDNINTVVTDEYYLQDQLVFE